VYEIFVHIRWNAALNSIASVINLISERNVSPMTSTIGPWKTLWRPGDEPGMRQFMPIGEMKLEAGGVIPDAVVCYETAGTLNANRSNAILVLHGFTADSHAMGPAGPGHPEAGWWDGVIGPGLAIDTDRYFVVVPNALGGCQGSTGPGQLRPDGNPWGSQWPVTTIRDMVTTEIALADRLCIDVWYATVGVSLGGMRALEWAVTVPERQQRTIVIGVGAQATAEQIGLQTIQMKAITDDPAFSDGDYYGVGDGRGPVNGMRTARMLGHLTYRSEIEMHQRFGNRQQNGAVSLAVDRTASQFGIVSYLDHAGTRLERRFDPNTYLAINEAMNHHDIGRDRGGVIVAMKQIVSALTVVGMEEDRLYPIRLQKSLVTMSPKPIDLQSVRSIVGHDAFLTDDDAMTAVLRPALC
jgi:homoserine O-acetyltransferase/O-succinyltransferase